MKRHNYTQEHVQTPTKKETQAHIDIQTDGHRHTQRQVHAAIHADKQKKETQAHIDIQTDGHRHT
jgi:hypothetical protein